MVFTIQPVYRFEIVQTYAGGTVLNTPHARWLGAALPTDADLLAFANAYKEAQRLNQVDALVYNGYRATQVAGDGVTYDVGTCRQIGGDAREGALTGTLVGGRAGGTGLPAKDCMVISYSTGLRGKSRHGRLYIGGLERGDQGAGVWTAGRIAAAQTAVDTFRGIYGSGGTDANWRWACFSRVIASGCKADPAVRHHPLVHVQAGDQADAAKHVTSAVIDNVVFSQRSRTVGAGV